MSICSTMLIPFPSAAIFTILYYANWIYIVNRINRFLVCLFSMMVKGYLCRCVCWWWMPSMLLISVLIQAILFLSLSSSLPFSFFFSLFLCEVNRQKNYLPRPSILPLTRNIEKLNESKWKERAEWKRQTPCMYVYRHAFRVVCIDFRVSVFSWGWM